MRYDSIQVLRGLAALSVVLLHSGFVARHEVWHIPFFSEFGWLGVQLFFVISGFIIADTVERSPTLSQFLLRRYLRVFPLYAGVTLAALVITLAAGNDIYTSGRTDSGVPIVGVSDLYLLKSLFLVPQDPWPFFMVGWSLEYEVVFYGLFGLAFFAGGRAAAIGIVALASLIGMAAPAQSAVLLGPNFVYFLAGCLCRQVHQSQMAANRALLMTAFVISAVPALLALYQVITLPWPLSRLPLVMAMASLLLLILHEESWLRKRKWTPHLVMLGNMSFSLYLVHWLLFPVASLSATVFVPDGWRAEAWRWGAIALSIYLAWGAWKYVEQPVNALVKRRLESVPRRPRPAAAQP